MPGKVPTTSVSVTHVQFSQETPRDDMMSSSSRTSKHTPWRTRRYMPYTKTPKTRNLRSTVKNTVSRRLVPRSRTPPSAARSGQETATKEILNKTWQVYRVSPLYKFSQKSSDLNSYSRVFSAYLQVEKHKGLAIKIDDEHADLATFAVLKGLKTSEADPEAIQITLKQKPKRGNGEACVVLTAILCCIHGSQNLLKHVSEPFRLLPVMLLKGPVALSRSLTQWLHSQFDCVIHPVIFPSMALGWMVSMWAGSAPEKHGRSVELQYKVPSEVEGLTTITMDIDPHDCQMLWKCIHTSADDSFHEEEVVKFISSLESHFCHHFKVNISAMPLARVGTSIAYVSSAGKLKIFSEEHLLRVLSHLTEVVMESTLCLH